MTRVLSVLLLGPSGILETDSGNTGTMADMLRDALARSHPDLDWQCRPELFFISEGMADRALASVERSRPDAVGLLLGAPAFSFDFVGYRMRRRYPWLYAAALAFSSKLKTVAGGGTDGSDGARGLLYRLPYRLARAVIGAEPAIAVPDAIRCTNETIDSLARSEDVAFVCRVALPSPYYRDWEAESRSRVKEFNAAVTQHCETRRTPSYDLVLEMAGEGRSPGFRDPGPHLDRPTREFDMKVMAGLLASSLVG